MSASNKDTLPPRPRSAPANAKIRVPALTMICHHNLKRVGETTFLGELGKDGAVVAVLRETPVFERRGEGRTGGIEDPCLSRERPAFEVAAVGHGQLELRPGSVETEVDGALLDRNTLITPAELERGVVVLVARSTVLCLHRRSLSFAAPESKGDLVGLSDTIEEVRTRIRSVADTDIPVLLRGESGTGKELVAEAIVAASKRADRPFEKVNMGGIAPGTAMAELFGHERGAFTGAARERVGFFGAADRGTLFLDEVGSTPPDMQPSLLRALDGEIRPVGATHARRVDVRIIAATDADLEGDVAARRFSIALLTRLSGYTIDLPPLRQRKEDFGVLLYHFLDHFLTKMGESDRLLPPTEGESPWLSASEAARMAMKSWPGNVRALKFAARQIVVSSRGQRRAVIDKEVERLMGPDDRGGLHGDDGDDGSIEAGQAFSRPASSAQPLPGALRRSPSDITEDQLVRALAENNRNITATARALGIPRTSLNNLIDRSEVVRRVNKIPKEEALRAIEECGGNLEKASARLEISLHGLKLLLARVRRDRD